MAHYISLFVRAVFVENMALGFMSFSGVQL